MVENIIAHEYTFLPSFLGKWYTYKEAVWDHVSDKCYYTEEVRSPRSATQLLPPYGWQSRKKSYIKL